MLHTQSDAHFPSMKNVYNTWNSGNYCYNKDESRYCASSSRDNALRRCNAHSKHCGVFYSLMPCTISARNSSYPQNVYSLLYGKVAHFLCRYNSDHPMLLWTSLASCSWQCLSDCDDVVLAGCCITCVSVCCGAAIFLERRVLLFSY